MAQGEPTKEKHEGLTTSHKHLVVYDLGALDSDVPLQHGLPNRGSPSSYSLFCGGTLLHKA